MCFHCGHVKKGNSTAHCVTATGLKPTFLAAAIRKNDKEVQNRLALCDGFKLSSIGAQYHKNPCCNKYWYEMKDKSGLNVRYQYEN